MTCRNILKFKHTDGIKEIVDLWDSVNTTPPVILTNNKTIISIYKDRTTKIICVIKLIFVIIVMFLNPEL